MKKNGPISRLLGSGFGTGFIPGAPGTAASLAAVIVVYFTALWAGNAGLFVLLVFWCAVTLLTSPAFELTYGNDPHEMTADEWAGQVIPFLSVSFSGNWSQDMVLLVLGFVLFRLFDIIKPFGINKLQKYPSGYGILLDDLLAGIYALILLKLIILVIY